MPSVSIVIPVLNRAAYLPRLFRSLVAVTYEDLEVLFVDNGSSDQSLSLCHSFAEEAPMVVRVYSELRPGANCARNRGLAACRTEWVYFFDSDDELSPTFLEEVMPRAADHDLVAFPTRLTANGQTSVRAFCPSGEAAVQILSLSLNTQGMLFRTSFLCAIGGWDERLAVWQDWELGIRCLLHSPRLLWLPERPFHLIHLHPDSITGPSLAARRDAIQQTVDIVASELQVASDLRALYLRCCLVNGQLRRQGGQPLRLPTEVSMPTRLAGRMLTRYAALGGRGAWRLALHLYSPSWLG